MMVSAIAQSAMDYATLTRILGMPPSKTCLAYLIRFPPSLIISLGWALLLLLLLLRLLCNVLVVASVFTPHGVWAMWDIMNSVTYLILIMIMTIIYIQVSNANTNISNINVLVLHMLLTNAADRDWRYDFLLLVLAQVVMDKLVVFTKLEHQYVPAYVFQLAATHFPLKTLQSI